MISNKNEVNRWFRDRGDYSHNINYDLTEASVIMDLGGYTGVWAQQMINKYNPNVYIIEPIHSFYNTMVEKFKGNDKVRLLNVGVSTSDKEGKIFLNGDGTSSKLVEGKSVDVTFNSMSTILNKWNLDNVDLIQINIEGDEYPLLDNMLELGLVRKFKNIQVQFHLGIENAPILRERIREGLRNNGFKIKFDYPFVWES
jgi:FkbM family methyltransferase